MSNNWGQTKAQELERKLREARALAAVRAELAAVLGANPASPRASRVVTLSNTTTDRGILLRLAFTHQPNPYVAKSTLLYAYTLGFGTEKCVLHSGANGKNLIFG